MEIDFDGFFLTRSWATDDLKRELDVVRGQLLEMKDDFDEKENALLDVERELETMEAKTEFIVRVIRETAILFTPPPESELEQAYEHAEELAYSKMHTAEALIGGMGGGAYLMGKLGPSTVKLARRLGGVVRAGKAAGTARLGGSAAALTLARGARAANAGKLGAAAKITKLGKGAMVLSGAIMALELGMKMTSAAEINDHLKRERRNIEKQIATAREELKNYDAAIAERRGIQRDLFEEADVTDLSAYLRHLNEAIADIGRHKANFSMARRMLLMGMDKASIGSIVQGLEADALDDIAVRLKAEQLFAAGASLEDVAKLTSLDMRQASAIRSLVDVRNALVSGRTTDEIVASDDAPVDLVAHEADQLADTIDDHWAIIEGDGDLEKPAKTLIVSAEALAALRRELSGKLRLDSGAPAAAVAADADASLETIKKWATDLAGAKIDAARMAAARPAETMQIAAALRLPSALVKAA